MEKKSYNGYTAIFLAIALLVFFIGFKEIKLLDDPTSRPNYLSYVGNFYRMNGEKTMLSIISITIAFFSCILNWVLYILKKNNLVLSISLNVTYFIGICLTFLSRIQYLLKAYNKGRDFVSGRGAIIFILLLTIVALAITILSICHYVYDRDDLYPMLSFEKEQKLGIKFKKLAYWGLIILSIGTSVVGGFIPFTSTTTEKNSFIDYDPNVGFVEKTYYKTKYLFTDNAYATPALYIIILFVFFTIMFVSNMKSKRLNEEQKDGHKGLYMIVSIILAILGNFLEFTAIGGLSLIFGAGFFIAIGAAIVLGAYKLNEDILFDIEYLKDNK